VRLVLLLNSALFFASTGYGHISELEPTADRLVLCCGVSGKNDYFERWLVFLWLTVLGSCATVIAVAGKIDK
jgi:hypothetical protein